jgi:hypothetical protein
VLGHGSGIANRLASDQDREAVVQQAEQLAQTTQRRSGRAARVVALLALASALVVQGCREEEQDRPLTYDKGTYQGQADQKLDQQQVEALRQRAGGQQI